MVVQLTENVKIFHTLQSNSWYNIEKYRVVRSSIINLLKWKLSKLNSTFVTSRHRILYVFGWNGINAGKLITYLIRKLSITNLIHQLICIFCLRAISSVNLMPYACSFSRREKILNSILAFPWKYSRYRKKKQSLSDYLIDYHLKLIWNSPQLEFLCSFRSLSTSHVWWTNTERLFECWLFYAINNWKWILVLLYYDNCLGIFNIFLSNNILIFSWFLILLVPSKCIVKFCCHGINICVGDLQHKVYLSSD